MSEYAPANIELNIAQCGMEFNIAATSNIKLITRYVCDMCARQLELNIGQLGKIEFNIFRWLFDVGDGATLSRTEMNVLQTMSIMEIIIYINLPNLIEIG